MAIMIILENQIILIIEHTQMALGRKDSLSEFFFWDTEPLKKIPFHRWENQDQAFFCQLQVFTAKMSTQWNLAGTTIVSQSLKDIHSIYRNTESKNKCSVDGKNSWWLQDLDNNYFLIPVA